MQPRRDDGHVADDVRDGEHLGRCPVDDRAANVAAAVVGGHDEALLALVDAVAAVVVVVDDDGAPRRRPFETVRREMEEAQQLLWVERAMDCPELEQNPLASRCPAWSEEH